MTLTAQPIRELLAGLLTRLTIDEILALTPGGIVNDIPQGTTYPCLRLWARGKPVGALAGHGVWDCDVEIWIYSQYAGDEQALQLADLVAARLHYQPLAVDGWTVVITSLEDVYPLEPEEIEGIKVRPWVLAFRVQMERA